MGEKKKMTIIINKCEKRNKKAKSVMRRHGLQICASGVNGAQTPDATSLQNVLNKTYSPARARLQRVQQTMK